MHSRWHRTKRTEGAPLDKPSEDRDLGRRDARANACAPSERQREREVRGVDTAPGPPGDGLGPQGGDGGANRSGSPAFGAIGSPIDGGHESGEHTAGDGTGAHTGQLMRRRAARGPPGERGARRRSHARVNCPRARPRRPCAPARSPAQGALREARKAAPRIAPASCARRWWARRPPHLRPRGRALSRRRADVPPPKGCLGPRPGACRVRAHDLRRRQTSRARWPHSLRAAGLPSNHGLNGRSERDILCPWNRRDNLALRAKPGGAAGEPHAEWGEADTSPGLRSFGPCGPRGRPARLPRSRVLMGPIAGRCGLGPYLGETASAPAPLDEKKRTHENRTAYVCPRTDKASTKFCRTEGERVL